MTIMSDMTGEQFKVALSKLRKSQKDFAIVTGHTPATVSRWAHGSMPIPKDVAVLVGLALEITELRAGQARSSADSAQ